MNSDITFEEVVKRSIKIRERYHELERQNHNAEWTVQEDALAFLSDAGLVGRLTMAQTGKWVHSGNTKEELTHKLGECVWWLAILSNELDINLTDATEYFLSKTEKI
ncbi:MazG-like protein [Acinetobacter sp. 2JN-4]|uniref:MazG-like protein n=1 Tax=Acinetobacter sp. 2JN-4 TaxID=2479844 RepID=UPI000EF9A3F2|nr:MazG-like protein [Acinetobacter sp. 2JN-4]RLZ10812.1 MazG-like protein [Acinetobacter sp. 2JN-4]